MTKKQERMQVNSPVDNSIASGQRTALTAEELSVAAGDRINGADFHLFDPTDAGLVHRVYRNPPSAGEHPSDGTSNPQAAE